MPARADKKPGRLDKAAERELLEARRWHNDQRSGLGDDLLDSLAKTLARIERAPRAAALVRGDFAVPVRSATVARFPYRVVYLELPDRWRVVAFAHVRRRPGYWRGRV